MFDDLTPYGAHNSAIIDNLYDQRVNYMTEACVEKGKAWLAQPQKSDRHPVVAWRPHTEEADDVVYSKADKEQYIGSEIPREVNKYFDDNNPKGICERTMSIIASVHLIASSDGQTVKVEQSTVARMARVSLSTVSRYMPHLRKAGILHTQHNYRTDPVTGQARQTTSTTTLKRFKKFMANMISWAGEKAGDLSKCLKLDAYAACRKVALTYIPKNDSPIILSSTNTQISEISAAF